MVNVGDLWIETSSNWIVVALFLLLAALVLMRITAPIYLASLNERDVICSGELCAELECFLLDFTALFSA